ncbi:MAG: hypothetical protein V1859_00955 [archaeon]
MKCVFSLNLDSTEIAVYAKTYDGNNNAHFFIINDTAIGAQEKYSTYNATNWARKQTSGADISFSDNLMLIEGDGTAFTTSEALTLNDTNNALNKTNFYMRFDVQNISSEGGINYPFIVIWKNSSYTTWDRGEYNCWIENAGGAATLNCDEANIGTRGCVGSSVPFRYKYNYTVAINVTYPSISYKIKNAENTSFLGGWLDCADKSQSITANLSQFFVSSYSAQYDTWGFDNLEYCTTNYWNTTYDTCKNYEAAAPTGCTQLSAVTGFTNVSNTNNSIRYQWTQKVGAVKYIFNHSGTLYNISPGNNVTYNKTSLLNATWYSAEIRAVNDSCTIKQGVSSGNISAMTLSNSLLNQAPTTPTSISCNLGSYNGTFSGVVNVACSGSTDAQGDAITYVLEKGIGGSSGSTFDCAQNTIRQSYYALYNESSDSPSSEYTANALDASTGTKWLDFNGADGRTWLMIDYGLGNLWKMAMYKIGSANDAQERDPKSWIWYGSNDNITWTALHTVTGETFSSRQQYKTYYLSNASVGSYRYYRWNVTEIYNSGTANSMQVSEIQPYNCTETAGSSITYTTIGNHSAGSSFAWDTSALAGSTISSLRCRAIDLAGSGNYSGDYTAAVNMNIQAQTNTTTSSAVTYNLVYDANGNLVTGDGFFRVYNSLNQLSTVYNGTSANASKILQEYIHDPIAEKIVLKKTYNSTDSVKETVYYFDDDYVRTDYHNGTVTDCHYVYLEGSQIAQDCTGQPVKFIHGDHLGSATVVTDANGNAIENTTYTPMERLRRVVH